MAKRPYSQADPDTRLLIRKARLAAGLTQEELAERLDTSPVSIGRYETGERQITVEKLLAIADALGIPAAQLIRDGDGLTEDERSLLAWLRNHPSDQRVIQSTLRGLQEARKEFEHDN